MLILNTLNFVGKINNMNLRKAVLIIHGFAGGTYDEESIANYLELKGFDVYSFTLPGHEKSFFNKVTKEDWINSVKEHLEMLIKNKYKNIYVIGHSMGGVLATYLAVNYKEVKKIILAAPAFKYLTFEEDNFNFINALKNSPQLFKDYEKDEIISRILHFKTSVIKEFMQLVDESQELPSKIKCPVLIIHGDKDIIVPLKSSKYIYHIIPVKNKHLMVLKDVNHDIFKSNKTNEVCIAVEKFLKFGIYNEKN